MRGNSVRTVMFLCVLTLGLSCQKTKESTQQPQTTPAVAARPSDTAPTVEAKTTQSAQTPQTMPPQPSGTGLNTELTNKAWDAFNRGDHDAAISLADRCINEFRGGAIREQEGLETKKTPPPRIGAASNEEKQAIFARGLLNDVATCLYIKGRCLEAKGQKDEATTVYKATAKYTYARCWDPQGWFWAPAEGAMDRLRMLE